MTVQLVTYSTLRGVRLKKYIFLIILSDIFGSIPESRTLKNVGAVGAFFPCCNLLAVTFSQHCTQRAVLRVSVFMSLF